MEMVNITAKITSSKLSFQWEEKKESNRVTKMSESIKG